MLECKSPERTRSQRAVWFAVLLPLCLGVSCAKAVDEPAGLGAGGSVNDDAGLEGGDTPDAIAGSAGTSGKAGSAGAGGGQAGTGAAAGAAGSGGKAGSGGSGGSSAGSAGSGAASGSAGKGGSGGGPAGSGGAAGSGGSTPCNTECTQCAALQTCNSALNDICVGLQCGTEADGVASACATDADQNCVQNCSDAACYCNCALALPGTCGTALAAYYQCLWDWCGSFYC
jgi:hypothetical protein